MAQVCQSPVCGKTTEKWYETTLAFKGVDKYVKILCPACFATLQKIPSNDEKIVLAVEEDFDADIDLDIL